MRSLALLTYNGYSSLFSVLLLLNFIHSDRLSNIHIADQRKIPIDPRCMSPFYDHQESCWPVFRYLMEEKISQFRHRISTMDRSNDFENML